jgi:hypothetical protein
MTQPDQSINNKVSDEERDRRIRESQVQAVSDLVVPPTTVFYLSFTDPDIAATIPEDEKRPGGPSWLGGCFVPASDERAAVGVAHLNGCNPGGQVAMLGPIPIELVRPDYLNRLLRSADEIEEAHNG